MEDDLKKNEMEDDLKNIEMEDQLQNKMDDDLKKKWKTTSKIKWKTNQSTKINLIGCDNIVNSPSFLSFWRIVHPQRRYWSLNSS